MGNLKLGIFSMGITRYSICKRGKKGSSRAQQCGFMSAIYISARVDNVMNKTLTHMIFVYAAQAFYVHILI